MYLRLSCRRFLLFVREHSGLRDRMKNKKIRCERRKDIQVNLYKKIPLKLIYRTYLNILCKAKIENVSGDSPLLQEMLVNKAKIWKSFQTA